MIFLCTHSCCCFFHFSDDAPSYLEKEKNNDKYAVNIDRGS